MSADTVAIIVLLLWVGWLELRVRLLTHEICKLQ